MEFFLYMYRDGEVGLEHAPRGDVLVMFIARSVNNGVTVVGVIKWVTAGETEMLPLLLSHLAVALVATHSCGNAIAALDR